MERFKPEGRPHCAEWVGWLPICILPLSAIACLNLLPAWAFMWLLSFAIYFSLKWLTWWKARPKTEHSGWRSAGYLFAWPGMDTETFLHSRGRIMPPSKNAWVWAVSKTSVGVILIWIVPRSIAHGHSLLQGWVGMVGLILLLHFGAFEIVALTWQGFGVKAVPIMSAPLRSTSLGEFWGRRWNLGFRQLSHDLVFRRLNRRFGVAIASLSVFLVSGLIHDVVISLPARGGYGLPTLYFLMQGMGVAIEHSPTGQRLGLRQGALGWGFTMTFVTAPVFLLFHPWFVMRVILPFMLVIHAL